MSRYSVIWSEQARAERAELRSFFRPLVERAVRLLQDQHRVLYSVDGRTVYVLRVIVKGRRTLGESL
jgi:hypothetical protein